MTTHQSEADNWSQVEIRKPPGQIRGVYAKQDIKGQTRIHLEGPIISRWEYSNFDRKDKIWLDSWQKHIERLSETELAQIDYLTYLPGAPDKLKTAAADNHDVQLSSEKAKVMAIFDANAWEGNLYHGISLWNHECEPNCFLRRVGNSDIREIITRCNVKAGDQLTMSYVGYGYCRETRQEKLVQSWGFQCECWVCKGDNVDDAILEAKQSEACLKKTQHIRDYEIPKK